MQRQALLEGGDDWKLIQRCHYYIDSFFNFLIGLAQNPSRNLICASVSRLVCVKASAGCDVTEGGAPGLRLGRPGGEHGSRLVSMAAREGSEAIVRPPLGAPVLS